MDLAERSVRVANLATNTAPIIGEIAGLLLAIGQLAVEVRGSRALCQEMSRDGQQLLTLIESMVANGNIKNVTALQDYAALLKEMHTFLSEYESKAFVRRLTSHGKLTDKIKWYYGRRELLVTRMGLEFRGETADRLADIVSRSEHIEAQARDDFDELRTLIQESNDVSRVTGSEIVAALTDLRFEIKYRKHAHGRTDQDVAVLRQVLSDLKQLSRREPIEPKSWYVSRDDVHFETDPFAVGATGTVHYGKWVGSGAKVVVKVVDSTGDDASQLTEEVVKWYPLRNPHVLPFYGACHITTPRFFVMAHAEKGNFNEYLPTHRHLFWKVFLDAARGLAYLHSLSPPIVHAHLKCSNLLVMADGTGVVSDFAFSFARPHSDLPVKDQATSSFNWHAKECMNAGVDGNARVQSDVYSLGMCLYEALTGAPPFAGLSDDEIMEEVLQGHLPPRPEGTISDETWDLITRMCRPNFQQRMKLSDVITTMELLAEEEQVIRERLECQCDRAVCNDCGMRVGNHEQASQQSASAVLQVRAVSWGVSDLIQVAAVGFRRLLSAFWATPTAKIEQGRVGVRAGVAA